MPTEHSTKQQETVERVTERPTERPTAPLAQITNQNHTPHPNLNLLSLALTNITTIKPRLRGKIHAVAFAVSCINLLIFLIASMLHSFNLGILIYLLSQILQFGVSSFYHIPDWSPRTKLFLRYLDHSCIFLLISGTQTSIIINSIPRSELGLASSAIKLTWAITILGISRFFIFSKLYDIFDLICYICHGISVLPFIIPSVYFKAKDIAIMGLGGIFYIVGGVVYGMERPNPIPSLIGYHEIFHIFTILANTCFGVVITRGYVQAVLARVFGKR